MTWIFFKTPNLSLFLSFSIRLGYLYKAFRGQLAFKLKQLKAIFFFLLVLPLLISSYNNNNNNEWMRERGFLLTKPFSY